MKIFVITQEDSLVIPKNMQLLADSDFIDVAGACIIRSKNALSEKKGLFIRNFGMWQVAKMGLILFGDKIQNFIDLLFLSKLLKNKKSVKSFCRYNALPYFVEKDINNIKFLEKLRELDLDLIVSFSAPSIFKSELLNIPKKGCINLHCSLLPKYSGILPSFWTLFNDEKETGATVHYMDDQIDNGDILGQKSVEILSTDSMFDIIRRTKKVGGILMVNVIYDIMTDKFQLIQNNIDHDRYYSWPTESDFRRFAEKRRLI